MQNEVPANDIDWDVIIIGSGFGGAVSALRMAEKGYRVRVVEQGRHITAQDMDAAATQALLLGDADVALAGQGQQVPPGGLHRRLNP